MIQIFSIVNYKIQVMQCPVQNALP